MGSYMRCTAIGNVPFFNSGGYAEKTFVSTLNEIWVEVDIRLPSFLISYLASSSNTIGIFSYLAIASSGGGTAQFVIITGPSTSGSLSANTWYTVKYHFLAAPGPDTVTIDLYLDGVLIDSVSTSPSFGLNFIDFGWPETLLAQNPSQQIDFDNIKIGTTEGGTDILETDFEDLQIIPPFDAVVDPGTSSIITTPPGIGSSVFIVTDVVPPTPGSSAARVSVWIDEVDVTEFCVEGSLTKRLNGAATASVKLNMRMAASTVLWGTAYPGAGSYLKVYIIPDTSSVPLLWHHGRVLNCETSADENAGYTVFNSSDPLELWAHRPVRDPPDIVSPWNKQTTSAGNFSKPLLIEQFGNPATDPGVNGAPRVIQAMMDGSELNTIPADSEGPLRLLRGPIVEAGSPQQSVVGAPTDWPMTMAELASLLTSTGVCDIVVTPIEMDGVGNIGEINIYAGDYGYDLTSTIAFQYGLGVHNVRAIRVNEDMTNLCNKLWYYIGPKCDDKHWPANVTGDDPAFNPDGVAAGVWAAANNYVQDDIVTIVIGGSTFTYICTNAHLSSTDNQPGTGANYIFFWAQWMVPPGGRRSPTASATNNPLGVNIMASRDTYDVRMDIQIFDGSAAGGDGECVEGDVAEHDMWRFIWQNEAWIRAYPRTLVHITPTRDTAIGEFDIGDLVLVEASQEVKGGFSGVQRVYGYTISWTAADSVPAISELQTSADQEGFLA